MVISAVIGHSFLSNMQWSIMVITIPVLPVISKHTINGTEWLYLCLSAIKKLLTHCHYSRCSAYQWKASISL